jgi:hypothetical protein
MLIQIGRLITINVPIVYMARDLIILMRATAITRASGRGGGPWKSIFLWALK